MKITCCACERKNIESSLVDPDFCQDCFDKTESKNIIQRADAYLKMEDTYGYNETKRKQFRLMAFIDLFHPEMPISKRLKLIK